jgi:Spy/CpxP family protein refolding chaperone
LGACLAISNPKPATEKAGGRIFRAQPGGDSAVPARGARAMHTSIRSLIIRAGLAPCVITAGLLSFTAMEASAQQRVVTRSFIGSPGATGGGNQIGTRSVEKYAKLLELSDDQRETVKSLHEGYQATYRAASQELQKELEEIREAFEDTQDGSVFTERMPAAQKKFRDDSTKAEAEFFNDFKLVLSDPQLAQWDKIERARRRETTLRGGMLSGEAVDLLDVVDGLKLAETPETLVEATRQYEMDLDRALIAKKSMMDGQAEFNLGGGPIDLDALRKRSEQTKEVGLRIKQVNQDHARRIEQVLPEDVRPAFNKAVKRQFFPQVYKTSQVTRSIDAAMKFDDLESSQRESLQAIKDSYDRDVAGLNDAWASEIEKDEMDPGNMSFGDGTTSFKISTAGPGGEEDQSPLAKARKARRELDQSVRERVNAALSPAQREKLPKAGSGNSNAEGEEIEEGEGETGVSGSRIIIGR